MNNENANPWPLHAMARRINVPAKWLRAEAEAGRIPALNAGGALLFDPELVEQIIRDRLRKAAEAKMFTGYPQVHRCAPRLDNGTPGGHSDGPNAHRNPR